MEIIKTEKYEEDGIKYIRETYDNGSIVTRQDYIYCPPETMPEQDKPHVTLEALKAQMDAMSRVQRGRTEVNGEAITIAIDPVDPMAAAVTLDVQGTAAAYAYSISAEALTVMFTEKVNAYINWEVRG